ncbi:MAG: ComEC/Rec2 family competence protein [Candidatus Nealsonbacteria bacterium]|nr:ComEC/Rec2 family competence protein [Candidatus Nealsonbacteria bacterium]
MAKSRIFLYFCLAFVGGIFAASFLFIPQLFLLGILIAGLFLISVLWGYKRLVVIGFCLLFLVLGIWRYQSADSQIVYIEEGNIEFVGIVSKEPDIRPNSIKLVVGNVLVAASRYPEYKYGDKLKIAGLLKNPPVFDDFNYRDYLKKDGIISVMNFPKIELLGSGFGNPAMKVLLSFKNKFKETTGSFISPPQEGILEALVFGQESNISQEWKDKLNLTGTRHIAAVSGMNITIISSLIASFTPFSISILLLFFYILMIGAPASALRAFIMAVIFLSAKKFGRMSSAPRAVFVSAAFMLLLNPFLLAKDVGFQLSFLAILGLIYLQPYFSHWLKFLPNPKIFPLRATLSATLAAQVFTLPILVYNFGRISLLSPIANILIVPFLAPITIFIFIFAISGIIFQPLGVLLSWPIWFSLTYIIKIIDWFSYLPLASLAVGNLHWIWLIISYLILGSFIWWYNKNIWK